LGSIRAARVMAEIDASFGRKLAMPAIRLSVGARSRASCERYADRPGGWQPDNLVRSLASSSGSPAG
jgi:hypothetical protein